ncbi:MAG: PIG-L family deacetylase, partial [Micrococcales bacterium]|nr:PIG-L family deacetylase [Micrococcales bacterium]
TSAQHRQDGELGRRRLAELEASASAIGAARTSWLGYADSGMVGDLRPDPPGRTRFLRADPWQVADQLAEILREEGADVLIGYDRNGGYGHRDHVRVHEIARLAAARADTPRLLEATVPRETITRALRLVRRLPGVNIDVALEEWGQAYLPAAEIAYRIDVRHHLKAKRTAMAAHASQAAGDEGDRTLAAFLRIPRPLYDLVFGREWFADATGGHRERPGRDILQGLTALD